MMSLLQFHIMQERYRKEHLRLHFLDSFKFERVLLLNNQGSGTFEVLSQRGLPQIFHFLLKKFIRIIKIHFGVSPTVSFQASVFIYTFE